MVHLKVSILARLLSRALPPKTPARPAPRSCFNPRPATEPGATQGVVLDVVAVFQVSILARLLSRALPAGRKEPCGLPRTVSILARLLSRALHQQPPDAAPRPSRFNPRPATEPGATSAQAASRSRVSWLVSILARLLSRALLDSRSQRSSLVRVSILARLLSRALQDCPRARGAIKGFNPRPATEPGATLAFDFLCGNREPPCRQRILSPSGH